MEYGIEERRVRQRREYEAEKAAGGGEWTCGKMRRERIGMGV